MTIIQIVRKKLDPAEVGGANTRYDDDCDCTQTTPDGGTTWIDNPGIDPRHSPSLAMPARTTSDPKCDAAANMRHQLEKFINVVTTVASQGAGASQILGVLAVFMPEVAILWLLCTEIIGGLLSVGQSVISAAFTTPIYDQLECIFYCNIGSDGLCSAAQLSAIETQIGSDIGGVVQVVMAAYLSLTGEVGLSNSGATGSETGDCSGCGCTWCYEFDFTVDDGGWTVYANTPWTPNSSYVAGVGFVAAINQTRAGFTDFATQLGFERTLDDGTFTLIRLEGSLTWGSDPATIATLQINVDGTGTIAHEEPPATLPLEWTGSMSGMPHVKILGVIGYAGTPPGGSCVITKIHLEGTGTNPFGSDNC